MVTMAMRYRWARSAGRAPIDVPGVFPLVQQFKFGCMSIKQHWSATPEAVVAAGGLAGHTAWAVFLPGMILFCMGAVSNIMVPGLYMDAVNPDYLVVRLLNPGTDMPDWTLPGTLLFGLFPVIGQIYHGALPFYVGLPVYALFGTGIVGVRLANLVFGLIVLVAAGVFLRVFRVRPAIAGICLAALALDPGFLFCFRTQFYITLLPFALLLFSVALVERRRMTPTPRLAVAAGFLAGFSVYGYFIYIFLAPVAAAHALWRWREEQNRRRLALWWLLGLAFGGAPYLVGMLLILIETGSVHGFLNFITSYLKGLGVAEAPTSLSQRFSYFYTMVWWTLFDVGPSMVMLQKAVPLFLPTFKLVVLLAVPALGLVVNLIRSPRSPGLFIVAGFFLGAAALVGTFGTRLWLHHVSFLPPLLYLALALTLELLATRFAARRAVLAAVVAIGLVLPLAAGNAIDRQAVLSELARTGGVGLTSDAVERFAEDSLHSPVPTHAFFPDWGVFMPFEMITRGRVPLTTGFTPQDARRRLCGGQDALLALMVGPGPDRLPAWIDEVGWGQPDIATYWQRDGVPVLTAIRWHASAPVHPVCPS